MKKLLTALSMVLVFAMLLSATAFAAGSNSDTLVNWDIKISSPDNTTAVLKGNNYYIYAQKEGSIPYVMVTVYNFVRESDDAFFDEFTDYMAGEYGDLEVTSGLEQIQIGRKQCCEWEYRYTISGGNVVVDRRIITVNGGRTYMFASKEVPARNMTVGSLLEDTVRDAVFLSDKGEDVLPDDIGTVEENEATGALMYLYCLDNGMPKFWLDLTGVISPNPVLHCYFRSSDPTFYESCYILDSETSESDGESWTFHNVYDSHGFDKSNWFRMLNFRMEGKNLVMNVIRDERTLAGGGEDNVLTGEYIMQPMGYRIAYEYRDDNRNLLYWLDLDDDNILLYKVTSLGEEKYVLDMETAEYEDDYLLTVHKVYDEDGNDVSGQFNSLMLSEVEGAILLVANSNASGSGAIIPSSVYMFEPKTSFVPLKSGPYTAEELGVMAQQYYMKNHGFFPPKADVEQNKDGSFTIHLYEVVDLDGVKHTATSAWYTVDQYGVGADDIYETPVNLTK
ncbi:MAG: hypothetical protein IKS55_08355 [Oscillospiraceae bacterium]|nr:hypothetical protein [Oscillospiraceae bacterium]